MRYPPASRGDLIDTIHGQSVADPYRSLEEVGAETERWSEQQDELARDWLDPRPGRERVRSQLDRLMAAGMVDPPNPAGDRLFFLRRAGHQEHAVLLVREADGTERVLVDPAELSPDGLVTLDFWSPSLEGELLAYGLSEGGDEEAVLRIMDVGTGAIVDGPIDRTRYSPLAWCPGGAAFYFGRRLPPEAVPAGEEKFHRRIWRHVVGTSAETDELVFGEGREKTEYHSLDLSPDGRWLLIGAAAGTAPRNDLYLLDVTGDRGLQTVQEAEDWETAGEVAADGRLYLLTSAGAPRRRIVVADPADPAPAHWRELVPESDRVLESFVVTGPALVVAGTRWAVASVTQHNVTTGVLEAEIPLPGVGALLGLTGHRSGGDDVWIGYTDFVTPPEVHHWTVARRSLSMWEQAPGDVEAKDVTVRQVWFASTDGTKVPMFLITRDDAVAGTPRPTLLTGYGGFNIAMTPAYAASLLTWVEAGGSYAIAGLRGGSEGGEEWHRAGRRERKQNVFDDFAAAARWLIESGWTTSAQLAISGGSNGGLLVGAALTQHPELYASVVCSAPLLDMVRYERFGLGETWNDEYGTAADPEQFGWLLSYSPYHHVTENTDYPAVLFTVFESDTRVDPVHARKLCAALQHATTGDPDARPILLRRERNVGHGPRSVSRTIDLAVDTITFHAAQVGLPL